MGESADEATDDVAYFLPISCTMTRQVVANADNAKQEANN